MCGAPQATAGCTPPTGFASAPPTILQFASNYQQPYVEQYNTAVEYQVAADTSVTVAYTGVHGVHIQRTRDINLPSTQTAVTASVVGQPGTFTYNQFTGARPNAVGLPGPGAIPRMRFPILPTRWAGCHSQVRRCSRRCSRKASSRAVAGCSARHSRSLV